MSNIMISKDTNMTTNEALVLRSFREMKTLKAIAVATALRSSQACSKLRMTKDSWKKYVETAALHEQAHKVIQRLRSPHG